MLAPGEILPPAFALGRASRAKAGKAQERTDTSLRDVCAPAECLLPPSGAAPKARGAPLAFLPRRAQDFPHGKSTMFILHLSLPVQKRGLKHSKVTPPHGARAPAKFPPEPASQGSDTEASEEVKAGRRPPRSGVALTV